MHTRGPLKPSLAALVVGLLALVLLPAQAFGKALIRFMHAVPGVGRATVKVANASSTLTVGSIGFGQVTPWRSIRSGPFHWSLSGGGKTLVSGTSTVGNGAYDIVVLAQGTGVSLGLFKASGGRPGTALVRVIHAAPELGSPELELDSKVVVKSLAFTQATPYLAVTPGMHVLGAMKPGGSAPLVSGGKVNLHPGVAYSSIVIGSRGQQVRVISVVDQNGPSGHLARRQAGVQSPAPTHSVMVKHGDSLWSIARSLLPAGASNVAIEHRLVQIWDHNARRIGTGNPNLIYTGIRLKV